jgi:mannitol-1-phosphate/altronate dehydrogenase
MKDPAKEKIVALTKDADDIHSYVQSFFNETGVFSSELSDSPIFVNLVEKYVKAIYSQGITEAIQGAMR